MAGMSEWLPPVLASGFVSAVVLVVGRLGGDRMAQVTKALEKLADSVGLTREQYVEVKGRAEEAHRRLDEHVKHHYEQERGVQRGD